MDESDDRGQPASFDRATGEVKGSGAGAGGGAGDEDHDRDGTAGGGHPLPDSEEARHNEIPESLERAKGHGDDGERATQALEPVNPDGSPYRADDLGRGPDSEQGDGNVK